MRMFSPKSPIVRLSLVLTLLTSGILVLSDLVGLFPSQYGALIEARKTVAETVAIQIASAVRLDSIAVIDDVLKALVDRDHALLSVAVRRSTGLIVASAGDHEQHWRLKTGKTSTETQVRVPLFNGKTEWGALELAFVPIGTDKTSTGLPKSFLVVVLFVVFGGFFAYMAFLRRALSELDPSAVVPQRVRGALDALAEGLVILDEQERILLANTAFARKLARTPESLVGVPLSSLAWLPADGMATLPPFPWNTVLAGEQAEGNTHLRLETAAKLAHTFALHAVGVLAADGAVRGALVTFDDLTGIEQANGELRRTLSKLETMQRDLARQNQELQVLATRDALSGSLNRRAIFEAFENLLRDSRETREELSCIMVDIDKFKSINDRYGHGVGDKVIKIVAGILNDTARATDLVGRYGGEEFCVLLPNTPLARALEIAQRIRVAIQEGGGAKFSTPMRVTASLGVSSSAYGAADPLELCNQSDRALYVAKESGRNKVVGWPEVADYVGQTPIPAPPPSATAFQEQPVALDAGAATQQLTARIAQLERSLMDSERARSGMQADTLSSGLPNWALLQDRLEQAIGRIRRNHTKLAVVALEIETYKDVNDALGIAYGERLIEAINQRLRAVLRNVDTISLLQSSEPGVVLVRLSTDQFVLVLTDLEDLETLPRILARITETMTPVFDIDGMELHVAPHLGIAISPEDGENAVTLVSNANAALRHAKQRGGEQAYHFYSSDMNARSRETIQRESDLRRAIERQEFILHYQPRVDIASGNITGVEALIRWNHPTQGMIMPDKFIPMAEKLHLIDAIGDWVITTACRQLADWTAMGLESLEVAVNVSPLQLHDNRILGVLKEQAAYARLDPSRVEIELTESVVIGNFEKVVPLIEAIAKAGFKIALDDFGTGYSSLSYLRRFPLHRLKIDRSFLFDLGDDATDYAVVGSVIEMAHSLDLRVVAEGVETEAQWEALRELGCDEAQGYLLSRPVSVADATELLGKTSTWRRKLRVIEGARPEPLGTPRRVAIKGILNDADLDNAMSRWHDKAAGQE